MVTCVLLAVVCALGQQSDTQQRPEQTSIGPPASTALYGLQVKSIHFRGVPADEEPGLFRHIEQKIGEPLDRGKIQRSIRALFATGFLDYIAVEAKRSSDGVELTFVLTKNYFVGSVEVAGLPKKGPNEAQLVNASNLDLGELFTQEKLEAAFPGMQKVLQDNGYYRAKISAEKTVIPEKQQVNILFRVEPGRQAKVGNIVVEGTSKLSSKQLQDIAKLHTGDAVRAQTVTKALQRLRKRFQREARLEAQTTLLSRKYVDAANTVDYTFSIDAGPTVEIRTEGAKVSQSTLKKYVPVYEEGAVDDDLLNEGKRNLTDYFQTLGFFDATVDFKRIRDPENKHVEIVYTIDRGPRHKLVAVEIDGNKYFPSSLIRERMTIQPAGWLLSHGRYSQSLLNRDVNSIAELYRSNGFSKVDVKSQVLDNVGNDPERMAVVFHISEGPQLLVKSLVITGNQTISGSELKDMLSTIAGQPFSEINVAQDRDLILNYYFNRGFPSVQVTPYFEAAKDDANGMDVRYEITEGPRSFVDHVYVTGLEHTRPAIVDRDISIKPGDPLSQLAMLDSQRRLYDLGIFNQVDMAVQDPDGTAEKKNLLFDIREAKRYTFNYGFGVEIGTGVNAGQGTSPQGQTGISPRVSFDVTRLNFRGKDQSIIFKSSVGALQQRVLLTFDSPRLFDRPNLKWTVSGFYDNTRDVTTFTSQRLEAATQLEQKVSKSITMLYGFSYRRVKASDLPANFDPKTIALNSQPVRVGIPSIAFIRDRRDDPLDSTKGNYTIANFGVASGYFGSETNFGRIFIQNATYHTFKNKWVLARSTRFGYEAPYGSCPTCLPGESPLVPLPERFFEGGGNSHRGFSINQAGPRDLASGTPLGGSADFINNIELRLPPMTLPWAGQNLSLVFFHDMGNVFPTAHDMFSNFFRWKQKAPASCKAFNDPNAPCDFNFIAHAIGTGVRYKTPIGPVRVDFGYNLNPAVFPIKDPIAPAVPHYETIRRFNVFFSIGQTF
ncbi:MAG TPA: outer membrane protein assembly factor BamA [Terriglobales bacterium]|nr:outer membrane protein assembly factor BamA [Terriglobales bacterium]